MNQTVVCLHVFVIRGECRGDAGCERDVEFAAIPHIIAKSAKYPASVMGTSTGCTTSRKNITEL
jgi:hypothetical protein